MDRMRLEWATVPIFVAALLVVGILAWRGMSPESVMLAVTSILAGAAPSILFKPKQQQVPLSPPVPPPPPPPDEDESTPPLGGVV